MLARNSIGRSISLLNDDSITGGASKRSTSTSTLPSISSFYTKADSPRTSVSSQHHLPLRTSSQHQHSISSASSSTNYSYSRKSSYAATPSSQSAETPLQSAVEYSPALSPRSIFEGSNGETAGGAVAASSSSALNGRSSRTLYSPDYGSGSRSSHYQSLSSSSLLSHQRHNSNSSDSGSGGSANTSASSDSTTTTATTAAIPHRPAGPTPLLLKRPHEQSSSVYGGTTTTSSSKGSSSFSILTSNSSNNSSGSNSSASLYSSGHHSLSSSSSASRSSYNTTATTPLTPNTPVYAEAQQHRRSLDTMDTHKSSAYGATMLSSPTSARDPFLYPSGLTGSSYPIMNNYNLSTLPNLSVAQQPLPPAISSSSPVMMYSSIDSPASATSLMDPYLQQPVPNIPFAPYPNELIPGALPPTAAQSVAATSPSDTSNTSGPKMAKKKYPCPHAAKYNCSDTFTTSGHAARHGKKHTGEKNIHCPVCDKAFTRKDNMKQHERTHRNKGEASKVAEAIESSKRAQALSKVSTSSSNEVEMEDPAPPAAKPASDPQATIRAVQQQRRPQISPAQRSPPSLMPSAADIPMPVTLDSGETLQRVAPSFKIESMNNIFDHSFNSRSQENILGRPAIFERTTSTGSGFSADGEGESPGLDALAMAAELS